MKKIVLIGIIALLSYSCNYNEQETQLADSKQIKEELIDAIEERFITWRDNDFEGHMKTYHEDWKRWAMREDKLLTKEEFSSLWERMKKREESHEMEIKLVDYNILGDGSVALVHFTTLETFKYIDSDFPPYFEKDSTYQGVARWSDVLVKENDKWLVIGGHRDRSQSPESLNKISISDK